MKIALGLSGGGVRALTYHLGTLKGLAQFGLLEEVDEISSVSGGSLCIALVYLLNDFKWPTSKEFLDKILPRAYKIITEKNLEKDIKKNLFLKTFKENRGSLFIQTIEREWGLKKTMRDLPSKPNWIINTTCSESGSQFFITKDFMGNDDVGFVDHPNISIAKAVVASAAIPGVIGSVPLLRRDFIWNKPSELSQMALVDGGLLDNSGLEYYLKAIDQYQKHFIILSDATQPTLAFTNDLEKEEDKWYTSLLRLTYCTMDQLMSSRCREMTNHLKTRFLCSKIAKHYYKDSDLFTVVDEEIVKKIYTFDTTLRELTHYEFYLIEEHGYKNLKSLIKKQKYNGITLEVRRKIEQLGRFLLEIRNMDKWLLGWRTRATSLGEKIRNWFR